jgi:ribosomal protein L37E
MEMVKCENCGRSVFVKALFCCHCGYPMAVTRWIPWPRQWRSASPLKFWKAMRVSSIVLIVVAAIGIVTHVHRGLPCIYCGYLFALSLLVYFWVYLGSEMSLGRQVGERPSVVSVENPAGR